MGKIQRRPETHTSSARELELTLASLRRQAETLGELQRRCVELRGTPAPSHAEVDAVAAEIDAGLDACLLIAERAAGADPGGEWRAAVKELERQIRRLGVLRSQILSLYLAAVDISGAGAAASRGRVPAET